MSQVNSIFGAAVLLTALMGLALADTGPGGGCHTDFYYSLNQQGEMYEFLVHCSDIDCPTANGDAECPIGGGGGWRGCACPGQMEQCDLYYQFEPGSVNLQCLFGCPGTEECFGPGPYDGGGAPFQYKATCWCE
jgi:hypothetical protein